MHIRLDKNGTLSYEAMRKSPHILGGTYIAVDPSCPYERICFNYYQYTFYIWKNDKIADNVKDDYIYSGSNKYDYVCSNNLRII